MKLYRFKVTKTVYITDDHPMLTELGVAAVSEYVSDYELIHRYNVLKESITYSIQRDSTTNMLRVKATGVALRRWL